MTPADLWRVVFSDGVVGVATTHDYEDDTFSARLTTPAGGEYRAEGNSAEDAVRLAADNRRESQVRHEMEVGYVREIVPPGAMTTAESEAAAWSSARAECLGACDVEIASIQKRLDALPDTHEGRNTEALYDDEISAIRRAQKRIRALVGAR